MKRECDAIKPLLGACADKELDVVQADRVRQHLATCPDCPRELAQLQELHRLAKSVEHPQLADDYWYWHRHKVWRGIREQKRPTIARYQPSFLWPKLAAAAGGALIALVVVIVGWRMFTQNPTRFGEVASERKNAVQAPVAAAPAESGAKPPEVSRGETETVADAARAGTADRAHEPGGIRAAAERDVEKTTVGYAGKGAGAAGVRKASQPKPATVRMDVPETTVAAEESGKELAAAPSSGGQQLRASSKRREDRIVSGPVLLESPPMPDADALDTGTVLLSVRTDTVGRVLGAAVRRSSGSARLDSVAVRQMRLSRFKAAVRDNRSVPSTFEYPFRFQKKQVKPQEQPGQQDKDTKLDNDDTPSKPDDQKQEPKPKLKERTKK